MIPRWLCKRFGIRKGIRARVQATPEGILVKPITTKHIHSLRGSLKGTGVLQSLMEDRKREREL